MFGDRCADWNTPEYFAGATSADIEGCLAAGRSVREYDRRGMTPVHAAAVGGSLAGLSALVAAGGEPNASGFYRLTPLIYMLEYAKSGTNLDLAMRIDGLLALGAYANAADWRGMTPLHHTAYFNSAEALGVLLDAGADPNAISFHGNALHILLWNEQPDKDAVALLLAAGTDPNTMRRERDQTPLHYIATHEAPAVVDLLVDAGADVNAADRFGLTPLHMAAFGASVSVVQALLDAGADPQALDSRARMPLHYAVAANRAPELVRCLLRGGSDPNALDGGGNSALHLAAYWTTHVDVVRALQQAGARADLRNGQGQTPVEMARTRAPAQADVTAQLGVVGGNLHGWIP